MGYSSELELTWVICPNLKSRHHAGNSASKLNEFISLAKALPSIDVRLASIEPLSRVVPKTFFGSGKVNEISQKILENKISLVFIDKAITPAQQQNLEKVWGVKVLDRTALILEIFSSRAVTREGVLQVELAALTYQRTRLVRAWTHLERQRGGLGFVGGPGETQIEADKRAIDDTILSIKKKLRKVVKTRSLHRAVRVKRAQKTVSLIGYTNAGKSTIFNTLTGSDVFAEDMLFATLDPTARQLTLPNEHVVMLTDTVGFIADLPTELVAAFRSTLEEVLGADLILHIRDITHLDTESHKLNVLKILGRLGVSSQIPIIEIWNKIDLLEVDEQEAVKNLAKKKRDIFPVSALELTGIESLKEGLSNALWPATSKEMLLLPFELWKQRLWLYETKAVTEEILSDEGFKLEISWSKEQKTTYFNLFN